MVELCYLFLIVFSVITYFLHKELKYLREKAEENRHIKHNEDIVASQLTLLRTALDEKKFVLHYQPIHATSGELVGAEALVRWDTPDGLVYPDAFIPLIEASNLLGEFTGWVLYQALTDFSQAELKGYTVSVNVPPVQMATPEFFTLVEGMISSYPFEKERLILEVTESQGLYPDSENSDVVGHFRDSGYRLAMDDFGIGYSTLSRLKEYDYNELKIDKMFLKDLESSERDVELLKGIMSLCHLLNIGVTLEGVETAYHKELAESLQVEKVQGYFFSKPLPHEEFLAYIKQY